MANQHASAATQQVVKVRRDYNTWVANETLEDYALRYTPQSFRKWSVSRIANTAFSTASFLVLEAIGGVLTLSYGFINAFWAIVAIAIMIFLTGLPISYAAARQGLDMDLLTRGSGFGYIGSTLTSFIYASFTFILFALEAAIMAYALNLCMGVPLVWAYLISALVIIPLVTHGVTLINRIQLLTQPLWIVLMLLPLGAVLYQQPQLVAELVTYSGEVSVQGFDWAYFGAAVAVGMALITQIGEQVDYLRFMPPKKRQPAWRWHLGVIMAGPGWVLIGLVKMLAGALLAYLAVQHGLSAEQAANPTQMYLLGYGFVFDDRFWVMAATVLFVCISQIKINMTNAYAGSLAWSNFFARLTHSHPGRVVWVIFNTLIALMLMQFSVFQMLEQVLGLYANIAISWIAVVVADLVINKPLGLSPRQLEFRRAYLYDINPVGVGAMLLASILSVSAYTGIWGELLQSASALIALVVAFGATPLIAWWTGGRYYLARQDAPMQGRQVCCICERRYEARDMAQCPAYQGNICSLCCTLDARCHDGCKPRHSRIVFQLARLGRRGFPRAWRHWLNNGVGHYLLLMVVISLLLMAALGVTYYHQLNLTAQPEPQQQLGYLFVKIFGVLFFLSGLIAWWLVLSSNSRRVAQRESSRQSSLLRQEIARHQETDRLLQTAKSAAEQANQAKSRYISHISHELRTPLNSILGYAQILERDQQLPEQYQQAVTVIRRSGEHVLSLIEGSLDLSRIESGHLSLDTQQVHLMDLLQQLVQMFSLQARNKTIEFQHYFDPALPGVVRTDKRRLQQILINILGNAIKFTDRGCVTLNVRYAREMALFEIRDTGPGISETQIEHIFEPFVRGELQAGGTGLGLTISKMLTDLMGGELTVSSDIQQGGTCFQVRLFLPEVPLPAARLAADPQQRRHGYAGHRRRIMLVDNDAADRQMLYDLLSPLGFELAQADSGYVCLQLLQTFTPDLILMDLAMPGIDGWETIRRLRQISSTPPAVAVVSANAFDRELPNEVALKRDDFMVKPIQVNDFLDWLGDKLQLQWLCDALPPVPPATSIPMALNYPSVQQLQALQDLIQLGYVRGIRQKLKEIETRDAARYGAFVQHSQRLLSRFQLDALNQFIANGRQDDDNATT